MKLKDFHTYGVNNKIECGAEKTGNNIIYSYYRGTCNLTATGKKFRPETTTSGDSFIHSPIKVKQGDRGYVDLHNRLHLTTGMARGQIFGRHTPSRAYTCIYIIRI